MKRRSPIPLRLLFLGTAVLGCEADPGLSTSAREPDPCHLGDVKPCTCPDGHQRTAACGGDGYFLECACGPRPAGGGFTPQSPEPDAEPPAPPTRPPRPRDALVDSPDVATVEPDAAREPPVDDAALEPEPDAAPEPPPPEPDAGVPSPAARCDRAPASVLIGGLEVFQYEASHPEATAMRAFPGAVSSVGGPSAPVAEPCSRAGVRPWHTVTGPEARLACEQIGWRLCSAQELTLACGGPDHLDWTFGAEFDAGACNLRQVYTAPGAETTSEAPTGGFPRCVSEAGVYDLTGNLWEWTADATTYQGGGWRILAEHHRESDLVCAAGVRAARDYRGPDVGFRCCRDAR